MRVHEKEPFGATPLEPDELAGLKHSHITKRGELDELEQVNVQQGLQWLDRRKKVDVLDDAFLRRLHEKLFGEVWDWAGSFRLREKNIGIDPRLISVQVRQLLGDAHFWSEQDTYSPLEAAARFHHRLVQIHPFPNGNGRHARICADIYLQQLFDHNPIDWGAGADLIYDNSRRDAYIAALRAADANNYDPILCFVGAFSVNEAKN